MLSRPIFRSVSFGPRVEARVTEVDLKADEDGLFLREFCFFSFDREVYAFDYLFLFCSADLTNLLGSREDVAGCSSLGASGLNLPPQPPLSHPSLEVPAPELSGKCHSRSAALRCFYVLLFLLVALLRKCYRRRYHRLGSISPCCLCRHRKLLFSFSLWFAFAKFLLMYLTFFLPSQRTFAENYRALNSSSFSVVTWSIRLL